MRRSLLAGMIVGRVKPTSFPAIVRLRVEVPAVRLGRDCISDELLTLDSINNKIPAFVILQYVSEFVMPTILRAASRFTSAPGPCEARTCESMNFLEVTLFLFFGSLHVADIARYHPMGCCTSPPECLPNDHANRRTRPMT